VSLIEESINNFQVVIGRGGLWRVQPIIQCGPESSLAKNGAR
jgi:hypothetical protein